MKYQEFKRLQFIADRMYKERFVWHDSEEYKKNLKEFEAMLADELKALDEAQRTARVRKLDVEKIADLINTYQFPLSNKALKGSVLQMSHHGEKASKKYNTRPQSTWMEIKFRPTKVEFNFYRDSCDGRTKNFVLSDDAKKELLDIIEKGKVKIENLYI